MNKNIYNFVSKDQMWRPSLMGVFHDGENKVAVASDQRVLLLSKPDYNEQLVNAGRHSYDKDGREIITKVGFPPYIECLSEGRRLNANRKEAVVGNLNAKAVKAAIDAAKKLRQQVKDMQGTKHAVIKRAYVRIGNDWFNAELLSKLLPYFGDGAEVIMPKDTWRAAYLKNNNYEAIIMPCTHRDAEDNIVAHAYAASEGSGVDIDQYIPESAL